MARSPVAKSAPHSAGFILTILVAALALTVACGDADDSRDPTPSPEPTHAVSEASLSLERREVGLGDVNTVGGKNWTGTGPVSIYLLTTEQIDNDELWPAEAVLLGEETPAEDGTFSLDILLQGEYEMSDGSQLLVASGDELYVGAVQTTEDGSHSLTVGPMIVGPE